MMSRSRWVRVYDSLLCLVALLQGAIAAERHYYIAAINIKWDYTPQGPNSSVDTYTKVVYREFDADFKQAKPHPPWQGLLGPTLRGQEGDTIVVTFRNMADHPCSIHPHGVAYGKQSEGALYFDNTSLMEKEDDVIVPGAEHTYHWEITPEVAPKAADPPCVPYTYLSHYNLVKDYNTGLIGTMLICKKGILDEAGMQNVFQQEVVLLFGVFDESWSWNSPGALRSHQPRKYTINGFANGTIPGLSICAHTAVSWHLLGMSSEPELFSVHFNGQVLQQAGHSVSAVGLISGTATSANMTAIHPGRWLVSSHISKHLQAGMHGFLSIEKCEEFSAPNRKLTIQQWRESQEWTYYIAAEEITWDYTPNMPDYIESDFRATYLKQGPDRIGKRYKKAVFMLYEDGNFTKKIEDKHRKKERGILGPVIRAQIRDVIKIVFKNNAKRPYSIYPHGLTIDKAAEGVNYPEGGNQTHAVLPGETHTYLWIVAEEDEPTDSDARCLTRMYHSAVDTPRDIASGLVGPLLICKSQSLNKRNVQLKADKEQHAMFAVFDENKSWYLDENIKKYCSSPERVRKDDPEFYKSNVMHTINGYVYESGQVLGFCNGEIVTWHVSSIGEQDHIATSTFYGHTFELNNKEEDVLSLFPMTGETITMAMDNLGIWLLASMNSQESAQGVRVKFQDVECFRDYFMEYTDDDNDEVIADFSVWKPLAEKDIKKQEAQPPKVKNAMEDEMTALYADLLDLRTFKNKSDVSTNDMELLDLSLLMYDDDLSPANTEASSSLTDAQNFTGHENNFTARGSLNDSLVDVTPSTDVTLGRRSNSSDVTLGRRSNSSDVTLGRRSNSSDVTLGRRSNSSDVTLGRRSNSSDVTLGRRSNSSDVTLGRRSNSSDVTLGRRSNSSAHGSVENSTTQSNITAEGENRTPPNTYTTPSSYNDTTENSTDNSTFTHRISEVRETAGQPAHTFTYSVSNPVPTPNHTETHSHIHGEAFVLLEEEDLVEMIGEGADGQRMENAIAPPAAATNNSNASLPANSADLVENSTRQQSKDLNTTKRGEFNFENVTTVERVLIYLKINSNTRPGNNSNSNISDATYASGQILGTGGSKNGLLSSNETLDHNSSQTSATFADGMTGSLQNALSNSSGEESSESVECHHPFNLSSTAGLSNCSQRNTSAGDSSSSEEGGAESREEVAIYLQGHPGQAILSRDPEPPHQQGEHWSYDSSHVLLPMEIPDNITKYITDKTVAHTNGTKSDDDGKKKQNVRIVHKKVTPWKGHAMKTKKRKVYKSQPRSSLPLSPRGLPPPGFSPRGSRPVYSDEDVKEKAIVIGVPRYDFNDYELYVPNQDQDFDHLDIPDDTENEYEYVEYKDPYAKQGDIEGLTVDETAKFYLEMAGSKARTYFITAEEVDWDYAGYGQRRHDELQFPTRFTKVVFRGYLDSTFSTPDLRGEMDEHLGILGPVIRAEVDETIIVSFRNLASRPYSLHANGVTYTKQMEGLNYNDQSPYWFQMDNEVQPNSSYTYIWKVTSKGGPLKGESDCRTWAYYSGVNPERDIHSGLVGPLLVCRKGTLAAKTMDSREFMLLFMTFDETKSWYYTKNRERLERKNRRTVMDPQFHENIRFPAINGIIHSLKGLRMYTQQVVQWHLMNLGSWRDLHSVHFHGQTFLHKQLHEHRQAVHPLLPGGFATLEMVPSKAGLWLLESEAGLPQQRGMQTLFLLIDKDCDHPLGLMSGSVRDDQITASSSRGHWLPHLARLHNTGKYNAWSTTGTGDWLQVDFQRPVVISKVATQGAKQFLTSHFVLNYTVSYSTDRRKWTIFKGDSNTFRKTFDGNQEAYEVVENVFFPPIIGRFVRLHPSHSYNYPTLRVEFYGCELDGCSVPLGMQSGVIEDRAISASSTASNWYSGSWHPWLARLDKQGTANAWQAKNNNIYQWLQVELKVVRKITGIVTQGAKSLGSEMFVTAYALEYSEDGKSWIKYTDDEDYDQKIFPGNTGNNGHMINYIYPPIFSRFIRIIPKRWQGAITMRIELLGCDFE